MVQRWSAIKWYTVLRSGELPGGGFPESVSYSDRRDYASSVFQKVLLGDIVERNKIRSVQALKLLVKKIAESVRSDISYSRLHHALASTGVKASRDTVIDCVSYIKDAYLVGCLSAWNGGPAPSCMPDECLSA